MVNETFANRYLSRDAAVGSNITVFKQAQVRADLGQPVHAVVVGVAKDARWFGLDQPPQPEVYIPYTINAWGRILLMTRVAGDTQAAIGELRRSVLAVEPGIPLTGAVRSAGFGFESIAAQVSSSLAPRRFNTLVLGLFAVAAVLLSVIGIFGVTSHIVTLRTRELAVRVALGAPSGRLLARTVLEGMRPVGLGMVIGVGAALGLTRLMSSLLFGVESRDPVTFTAAAAIFVGVALLACYLPARRATKVDPMVALRTE